MTAPNINAVLRQSEINAAEDAKYEALLRRNTLIDKSCRSLKVLAECLEQANLGILADITAWVASLLGDLSRLACNVGQRATSRHPGSFNLGSIHAIVFRVIKSLSSAARLTMHTIQNFMSLLPHIISAINIAIPVLTIFSAACNFVLDTIRFCKKKAKNLTEKLCFSGKTITTAIIIAGVVASFLLGPAAPAAIALLLIGVIGYSACSITKAAIDHAKAPKASAVSILTPKPAALRPPPPTIPLIV